MNAPASLPPLLLTAPAGGVLRLVLNRPQALNALSSELMVALMAALDGAAGDNATRVIVIAAEGPVFSSGHDLKEMTRHRADGDAGRAAYTALFAQCSALMQAIVRHPKPVIAQVQGIATAAGCQLVASCDLAIASTAARFATPGVNIGLFCSTPMVALSRNMPLKAAMQMLLTGEMVAPEDALRIGLINKVVAPEALESETLALARLIAGKPRATLKTGKEAFYRQLEMPLADAYDYASKVMTENMLDADAKEGIGASGVSRKERARMAALALPQYPDTLIKQILRSVKTIAMVGASGNDIRPSYFAMMYLLNKGYKVVPVNPGMVGKEILGQAVYASLKDVPAPVDMVDVFREAKYAPDIARETVAQKDRLGVKVFWMQLGVISPEAEQIAADAGLTVVMNRCPKIEHGRFSGELGWMGVNRRIIDNRKPLLFGKGGSLKHG